MEEIYLVLVRTNKELIDWKMFENNTNAEEFIRKEYPSYTWNEQMEQWEYGYSTIDIYVERVW